MTRPAPSPAEIAVLEALAAEAVRLSARLAGVPDFQVPLLHVDPARHFLILGCSGDPAADAVFLRTPLCSLAVEWADWRIAFPADGAVACRHGGEAAIRVRFPETVAINRRRVHERSSVPESASLKCVAYSGAAPVWEAAVTDVSRGGIGIRLDAASDALRPGMMLVHCRLEQPGRTPALVDLEVRHVSTGTLADGRRVARAGCQFARLSPEAQELLNALLH